MITDDTPPSNSREVFDRQNIVAVQKRFLRINSMRLERMREALAARQQIFLDLLALFFHSNHPMMPGFVARNTPARISNYKPQKDEISLAKTLARSFTLSYEPEKQEDIYGIYVMGSVGTIAQSEGSDLDIWLCYRPGLDDIGLQGLKRKSKKLSEWAESLGIEVHFFLMNDQEFKHSGAASLDEESSGSAQKMLLLDEFYRTAIFICGRTPIWWLIPETNDNQYNHIANDLVNKRFINHKMTLDFGNAAAIPDGEFIGAGIWQLYKAIESPYKSALKLLLLEAYVSEYPNIVPLSLNFKNLIYDGQTKINALDSYVMTYQKIEEYLVNSNQSHRIEIARRCFYFKINRKLSRQTSLKQQQSWQFKLLDSLTKSWDWTQTHIAQLDQRGEWKALPVTEERSNLVSELNHSYQFLRTFASHTNARRAISSEELIVLGRKLQAAFERRPGKVDWINPNISDDITEEFVVLQESFDTTNQIYTWTLYAHQGGAQIHSVGTTLKSATTLIEVVFWSYYNGIINKNTQIEINTTQAISKNDLNNLFTLFTQWLPLPLKTLPHRLFEQKSYATHVLFIINLGKEPGSNLGPEGYQLLSDKSDALRYGGFQNNLINSIDMVSRNSWNEINCRRLPDNSAVLDALTSYLKLSLPGNFHTPPKIVIKSLNNNYASTIEFRLSAWFKDIISYYYQRHSNNQDRYIFEIAKTIHCLTFDGRKPVISHLKDIDHLYEHLLEAQEKFSKIHIDTHALENTPLRSLVKHCHRDAIEIFYRKLDFGTEVFVSDERGSLFHNIYRGQRDYNPVKALHHFLRIVTQREMLSNPEQIRDFDVYPIAFYELQKTRTNQFNCITKSVHRDRFRQTKFDVKATAHLNKNEELVFDFQCDDQAFSALSFGPQLDIVVAQFILSRRESKENYPVYLTDMDLELVRSYLNDAGDLQIKHYLALKSDLESRLNKAIGILLNV